MRTFLLLCVVLALRGALADLFSGKQVLFCSIQATGQNYCWGQGIYGQLGHGAFADSPFPVRMLNVQHATSVTAGDMFTCIVDQGKAKCTGFFSFLGRANMYYNANVLVDVEGVDYSGETVEQLASSQDIACLVTSRGGAKCWGSNSFGGLGNMAAVSNNKAYPITGFETGGVAQISPGYSFTCLLTVGGKVHCSGANFRGQLGRGIVDNNENNYAMLPIVGDQVAEETMVSISSGKYYACAVTSGAEVYCWGDGSSGQLGQGNRLDARIGLRVPGLTNVAMVFCGLSTTFVLLNNNQGAIGFGENGGYDLGLGPDDQTDRLSPVIVFEGEINIVDIKGGQEGCCIKLESSSVRCYGQATAGRLGVGEGARTAFAFVDVWYLPATEAPTHSPTVSPTALPTTLPTLSPTRKPSKPTKRPTFEPTRRPSKLPTVAPTKRPTLEPMNKPSKSPSPAPTKKPSNPTTFKPSKSPLPAPTKKPTKLPTVKPSKKPTLEPTTKPSKSPTPTPTKKPSKPTMFKPSKSPTPAPTKKPTKEPTAKPTKKTA